MKSLFLSITRGLCAYRIVSKSLEHLTTLSLCSHKTVCISSGSRVTLRFRVWGPGDSLQPADYFNLDCMLKWSDLECDTDRRAMDHTL